MNYNSGFDVGNNIYPKTLVIRNTPESHFIWQVYHVNCLEEANLLAHNAKRNGFYGITLEDYQPDMEETWPDWRVKASDDIKKVLKEIKK